MRYEAKLLVMYVFLALLSSAGSYWATTVMLDSESHSRLLIQSSIVSAGGATIFVISLFVCVSAFRTCLDRGFFNDMDDWK